MLFKCGHRPLCTTMFSPLLPCFISGVQSLQKQHEAFLLEVTGYESQVGGVGDTAQELVDVRHYATDQIIERYVGRCVCMCVCVCVCVCELKK